MFGLYVLRCCVLGRHMRLWVPSGAVVLSNAMQAPLRGGVHRSPPDFADRLRLSARLRTPFSPIPFANVQTFLHITEPDAADMRVSKRTS
jgi:hypothetical protein